MKKFKFRLDNVLRYREAREQKVLREFAAAMRALDAEERELARLVRGRNDGAARLRVELGERCSPDAIRSLESFLDCREIEIKEQEVRVLAAREFAETKRLELVEAGREKKLVEKLYDKEWERYRLEAGRDEQKFMDEVSGSRFIAGRATAELGE